MAQKNKAEKEVKKTQAILNKVIYRINQKMNLDASTMQDISNFLATRISGNTQIEFTSELSTEGIVEQVEFSVKDYAKTNYKLHLLFGDNPTEIWRPNILYVVMIKTIVKEFDSISVESEYLKEIENAQTVRYAVIVNGIIERIKAYVESREVTFSETVKEEVQKFLRPLVDGKVWVMTDSRITGEEGDVYKNIIIGDNTLKLAYSSNVCENEFPNILYVLLEEMENEARFRIFCEKRYIPQNISEQAIEHLDLSQTIMIQVFERTGSWREKLAEAKEPIIIVQEYNFETGVFRVARPIGFVEGKNRLILTSPNEYLDVSGVCYCFNQ